MMDHDLQNVSDADYKRLIAEAYPSPKRDIHAAVMAQVTAEAAQSRKKAKILTPAFRNRFVKYGSIAACFVLLVTLGFRVLPMMTKDAVMETENTTVTADMAYADEAAAAPQAEEGSAETQAAAGGTKNGAPVLYKAVLTDGTAEAAAVPEEAEEEIAEEPAAAAAYSAAIEAESVMDEGDSAEVPEPEAPMVMMAPVSVAEDSAHEEEVVEEAPAEDLIEEEVVEEAVVEECVVEEAVEECVVEEVVVESAVSPTSLFEAELKLALIAEIAAEAYTAWMTDHGYVSPESWSIAEFVTDFGIPRERFTELYDALTAFFAQTAPDAEILTYDLNELYPS